MSYPRKFKVYRSSKHKFEEFIVNDAKQNIISNEYYEQLISKTRSKIADLIKDIEFYREIIVKSEDLYE